MTDQNRPTPAHYHTACRRCQQPIIMGENVYPPYGWKPFDADGKGHACPMSDYKPNDMPSRNQARMGMDADHG